MRKKDIITIVISLVVVGVSLFFGLKMMGIGPKANNSDSSQQTEAKEIYVPGKIDDETYQTVNKMNDYGEATLDNIGRVNPFGPL